MSLKIEIEVKRRHYNAKLEFSEEEIGALEDKLTDALNKLDSAVQKSSNIWHTSIPKFLEPLLEILPNGTARFPPNLTSQIEQVIVLTAVGGRGGTNTAEVSSILDLPLGTITGYYQQEAYEKLFKASERGSIRLSSEGLDRLRQIQERLCV